MSDELRTAAGTQVGTAVGASVKTEAWVSVEPEAGAAVGDPVEPEVGTAFGASVKPEARVSVEPEARAAAEAASHVASDEDMDVLVEPWLIALNSWYLTHGRDLPWRRSDCSPWGIMVSEIMLQQTPVVRVQPRWEEWLERWPTPAALAEASRADVLRAWDRLGYPRRALRLHQAAHAIATDYDGNVPRLVPELLALPGLGSYTAHAIACFAFGAAVPVVDTNVRRVASRVFFGRFLAAPARTRDQRDIAALMPVVEGRVGVGRGVAASEDGRGLEPGRLGGTESTAGTNLHHTHLEPGRLGGPLARTVERVRAESGITPAPGSSSSPAPSLTSASPAPSLTSSSPAPSLVDSHLSPGPTGPSAQLVPAGPVAEPIPTGFSAEPFPTGSSAEQFPTGSSAAPFPAGPVAQPGTVLGVEHNGDISFPTPGERLSPLEHSVMLGASMMELGALVCTAKVAHCESCPIQPWCVWYQDGCPPPTEDEIAAAKGRVQKFEGTDRQVRGRIMARLRAAHHTVSAASLQDVSPDNAQAARALAGLLDDGLIVVDGDGYRLPD